MKVCIAEWIGKRATMEDAHLVRHYPTSTLAIVCDGMGGHDCGALAARTACDVFAQSFEQLNAPMDMSMRLRQSLLCANEAVGEKLSALGVFGGCTLLAVYVRGGVIWWVSVGDSPLMIWRGGRILRLNEDHSMRKMYGSFYVEGFGRRSQSPPHAHSLRSAVTGQKISLIDAPVTPYLLLPGDRILLASDGANDFLLTKPLQEMVRAALMRRGNQLAAELLEAYRIMDPYEADNVTVLSMDK